MVRTTGASDGGAPPGGQGFLAGGSLVVSHRWTCSYGSDMGDVALHSTLGHREERAAADPDGLLDAFGDIGAAAALLSCQQHVDELT